MIKRFFMMLGLALAFAAPLSVLTDTSVMAAIDPFSRVDCGNAADSTVCKTKEAGAEDPLTGSNGLIGMATNIISLVAGIAAVIFLVLNGLKYVTSNGAPDQISRAKEGIIYALIGLVLIVLAQAIIGFVLTKF